MCTIKLFPFRRTEASPSVSRRAGDKGSSWPTRSFTLLLLIFFSAGLGAQTCPDLSLDDITDPGVYQVATLTEADGIRNGPDYRGATIYYPTNFPGPLASIAMVPGFVSQPSSIQDWGPFLASHGIVTMIIGTNSLFDFPEQRRDGLLDAIVTLRAENTRVGSPLFGELDVDKVGVGGWSMGGGGAQLAATVDPTLRAVMALTPWLDPNEVQESDLDHPVPVLIFAGENDPTAPPAQHSDVHYDLTPGDTDKLLFEVDNGDHSVSNGPSGAGGDIGQVGLSWLQQYLVGDDCYCAMREDAPATASQYLTTVDCADLVSLPVAVYDLSLDRRKDFDRVSVSLSATDLMTVALYGGYDYSSIKWLQQTPGADELDVQLDHLPADRARDFYYRLQFIDYDGSTAWSDWLIAPSINTTALTQVQYGEGDAWLKVNEGGPNAAHVLDVNGRRLATLSLTTGLNPLPRLPQGMYILQFATGGRPLRYLAR